MNYKLNILMNYSKPENEIQYNEEFIIPKKEKEPLLIEYLDYLSIVVDQNIINQNKQKQIKISEREAFSIPSIERTPSQIEIIDEISIISKKKQPNKIQITEQITIEKIQKPENEVEYNEDIIILGNMPISNWSNNTIEERDSLTILRKEKAPMQQEYIDELFIKGNDQPENEIQLIDQMEILRQPQEEVKVQIPKINRISKNDKFTIRGKPKSPLSVEYLDYLSIVVDQSIINQRRQYKISERDELKIPAEIKEPSQVEYIDELFISGEEKPKNEIQLIDQMEILKEEKPESQEKLHKPKGIPSPQILQVEERDSILIKPNNKLPLQMEYIDEMKIESELKPQNEIQIVDQMVILKSYEKDLEEEEKEITINISSNKKETKSKPKEEKQPKDKVKLILIKEYIDELNIKGMESPNNEIQIVDQMLINRAYDKNKNISQNTLIEENYIIHPKSPLPQSPNEIQNIDQMVILPIPRKNLIIRLGTSYSCLRQRNGTRVPGYRQFRDTWSHYITKYGIGIY